MNKGALVDLHHECSQVGDGPVSARVGALCDRLPLACLTAAGGFPFQKAGGVLTWCGETVTPAVLRERMLTGLGASAVLTYTNRSGKTLLELGEVCRRLGHDWGERWLNLTVTFAGVELAVELAFARDARFLLSWPVVREHSDHRLFSATGSVKDWRRYVGHREDESFDASTREAMRAAYRVLEEVLP